MLRTRFHTLVAIAIVSFALPAAAGTKELSQEVFKHVNWGDPYVDRTNRLEIAFALMAYWQNFDARIPRLSPTERSWLEEEISSTETERIGRAIQLPEYGLWSIARHTVECLASLSGIIETAEAEHDLEMFYWLKMVNCYHDADELQRLLKIAKLSDGRHDGAFDTFMNDTFRGVLVNRITPSAMADTMGWTLSND